MGASTIAFGNRENNTELDSTLAQKAKKRKENGLLES